MESNSVSNHTSEESDLSSSELDDTKFFYRLIITITKFVIY